jgi:uncharacterized protein (DUF3084 family)
MPEVEEMSTRQKEINKRKKIMQLRSMEIQKFQIETKLMELEEEVARQGNNIKILERQMTSLEEEIDKI